MEPVTQTLVPEVAAFNSEYFPGPALQSKLFVRDPGSNRDGFPSWGTRGPKVIAEHALKKKNVEAKMLLTMRYPTIRGIGASGCNSPCSIFKQLLTRASLHIDSMWDP
jgi:hypothetical protein